jgi:protein-tyrosine phosphatase
MNQSARPAATDASPVRLDGERLSPFGRLVRRMLTSPLGMAVKAPLKDAFWAVRGRRLANPALPAVVRSILFVCKGNICRSPFAAYRAAQLLEEAGARVACESAGIQITQADRSPREACEAARAFGVRLDAHRPVPLTRSLLSSFDLIVVMEASQFAFLRQSYPDAMDRIWLLSLLDEPYGYDRFHIADPFGQPQAAFNTCYRRLDDALRLLVRAVVSQSR